MSHPIVTAARGWIGTRFHHQGRIKKTGSHKGGVDCLGLLAGVAAELDLRDRNGNRLAAFDETNYSHRPDTEKLREKLAELLLEIPFSLLPPGEGGAQRRMRAVQYSHRHSLSRRPHPNPLPEGEGIRSILPGDIVLLRIDESPQHLGIVSNFSIIPALCGDLEKQTQSLPCDSGYPPNLKLIKNGAGMAGLGLIHAYAPARAVVEHALDEWWMKRIEAVFRAVIPA